VCSSGTTFVLSGGVDGQVATSVISNILTAAFRCPNDARRRCGCGECNRLQAQEVLCKQHRSSALIDNK
jgi:hypothetical protein